MGCHRTSGKYHVAHVSCVLSRPRIPHSLVLSVLLDTFFEDAERHAAPPIVRREKKMKRTLSHKDRIINYFELKRSSQKNIYRRVFYNPSKIFPIPGLKYVTPTTFASHLILRSVHNSGKFHGFWKYLANLKVRQTDRLMNGLVFARWRQHVIGFPWA